MTEIISFKTTAYYKERSYLIIRKQYNEVYFSQQTRRVEKSRITVRSRHIASLALSYFAGPAVRENEPLRFKRTLSEQRFHQETVRVVSGFTDSSRVREIRKCRRSGKATSDRGSTLFHTHSLLFSTLTAYPDTSPFFHFTSSHFNTKENIHR